MNADDCNQPLHPKAIEGLHLFNAGKYFEAHEELEAAWKDEHGKIRALYQGILEAGVTYLHITRGNYAGALKVYGRSMKWLRQFPESCRGVDVERLRNDLDAAIEEVKRLGEKRISEFNRDLLKPVAWKEGRNGK
jgi:uncharacterized protein